MKKIGARINVSGRVQGVGFRFTSQMLAHEMGITGWVKNSPNGTVEIVVEGPIEKVYQFIDQIKDGPSPAAHVEDVTLTIYEELKHYKSFDILY